MDWNFVSAKAHQGFYAILAYTLVNSEFKNASDDYVPTAWDRTLVSLTEVNDSKRMGMDSDGCFPEDRLYLMMWLLRACSRIGTSTV